MRKKETKKHKKEIRKRYERSRQKAKEILMNNHKREYKKILKRCQREEKFKYKEKTTKLKEIIKIIKGY